MRAQPWQTSGLRRSVSWTARSTLVGITLLALGCNALWGLDGLSYDRKSTTSTTSVGAGGVGGEAGRGGTAAAGGSGGSAGQGGAGGSGGAAAECGNGIIEGDEECDDANNSTGDGCAACMVECDAAHEHHDPLTHHCYWVTVNRADWDIIRQECVDASADLATVTSDAELSFVLPIIVRDTYLGGHDRTVEGTWQWVTGEPWSYSNWADGEPNNTGGIEDCAEIHVNGEWNDCPCGTDNPALCERPPPENPP